MPAYPGSPSAKSGELPAGADAILALGSNIGDGVRNVEEAIARLAADARVEVIARSRLYRSAPWGVTDQAPFVNACVTVRTTLSPHQLLDLCHSIENAMGRVRTQRWGPRKIDVDILTYDDLTIQEPDLSVPHPRIAERAFVLIPLKDVAPDMRLGGETIGEMLGRLDASDVQPLAQ